FVLVFAGLLLRPALGQTWSNAALLNEPGEAGSDVKTSRVVAANNGFHAVYHVNNKVRYRRYFNGSLKAAQDVFPGTNFIANGQLAVSLDGTVHVVLEDWA